MVKPVDEVAFQVLQAVGITLPIFILSVDAFVDEEPEYERPRVFASIGILVLSALVAIVTLIFGTRIESFVGITDIENPLANASMALLWLGYLGLGWSLYDMMDLEQERSGWVWIMIAAIVALLVFTFSIFL